MTDRSRTPAHNRLFTQFAEALKDGATGSRVETPAFAKKEQPIGDVLADLIGGDEGQQVLALLLASLGASLHSTDPTARLTAMAASAGLARMHADYHAEAAALDDADSDDAFERELADRRRWATKDDASLAISSGGAV